jgi:protein phosphatase
LNIAAISHPGMSGKNNEDRYGVSAYRLQQENGIPSVLAIVADGIGGHRAGEVAAEIAVEVISRIVAESDANQPVQTLQKAIIRASQVIHERSEAEPALKGMGSTCACVWVIGDRLYTASVGDTRIYLLRDGAVRQLTKDHTWVQEAIDNGAISVEEARSHPNAHVIRRYLGSRNDVVPDTRLRLNPREGDRNAEANQGTLLQANDCILLCSDGLTDLVHEAEILAILGDGSQEEALERLVTLANQRGGHDNITAVTLQVPGEIETIPVAAPVATPARRLRLGAACLTAGVLLFVALLAAGGLYWFFSGSDSTATPATTTLPAIQPAFPRDGTILPSVTLPATETRATNVLPGVSASLTPSPYPPARTPGTAPTLSSPATLTPWPTNTVSP